MKKLYLLLASISLIAFNSPAFAAISQCNLISSQALRDGVEWKKLNCSDTTNNNYNINIVDADTSVSGVSVKPLAVSDNTTLKTLPQIATQNTHVIAGVNGGFFYNGGTDPDIGSSFRDNICPLKTFPQTGNLGDSLNQIDGQIISTACATSQNYLRSVLVLNGNNNYITQTGAGQTINNDGKTPNVIGAGPTLVKENKIFITQEGFEWYNSKAARTAAGIKGSHILLVTIDKAPSNGMTITELADFMLNYLQVTDAINLDGGGSTTMCINNSGSCNVVNSPSDKTGTRSIYNGLFILSN